MTNDLIKNSTNDFPKKMYSEINLSNLPNDLRISTMTITCNFDTLINIQNVGKYIDLSFGNIVCVKYGSNNFIRTLIKLKKTNKKSKKKHSNFYNQATLIVEVQNKRRINVKLFKNGAIQMTGCKNMENYHEALSILCKCLLKKKAVYDKEVKKIIDKPFVIQPDKIDSSLIYNFKIRMINSNFHIGFLINRENLYDILIKDNVTCTYEPCIHACVNIKYNYKNIDIISIFVFESGSIIITGAKNRNHIMEAYSYITKILYENYGKIVKNDIEKFLERPDIQQLIKENSPPNIEITI